MDNGTTTSTHVPAPRLVLSDAWPPKSLSALAQTDKAETTIAYLVEIETHAIVGNAQASRVGCQRQAEEHV